MTWIPGQEEAAMRCRDGTHYYPLEPKTVNCQCGQTTREARDDRYVITARFSEIGQDEVNGRKTMRAAAEVRAMLERVRTLEPPYDPAAVVAAAEALAWVLGDTDELPADLD